MDKLELGDGRQVWHPSRLQLGFRLAPGIDPNSPASTVRFVVDRSVVVSYLTGIAPYVRRSSVNAEPVVFSKYRNTDLHGGNHQVPAKILPSREGAALEIDPAADTVINAVNLDPTIVHIVLPVRKAPVRITGESLAGIDCRIARFVTRFNAGDVGRTKTVRRAINLLDRHVVQPGGIFSVNQEVGERTIARGFGMGHVFVDGKMKEDVGGGMCQVASTLFNAALLGNLKIVERFQHVRTVPYVKAGSDATVWWGKKDFKLQNDTTAPIYISYRTTRSQAICEIFGKSTPGVKVSVLTYQKRNADRDYSGSVTRYMKVNGVATKTYESHSRYKWTPALDFSR